MSTPSPRALTTIRGRCARVLPGWNGLRRGRRVFAALVAAAVAFGATASLPATAQDETAVLVFTRTAGFRHLSIPDAIAAIESLGAEHGFSVEATEDPGAFTDENLARFDAVVFANTTGDVVEADGQAAFERYVRGGGGWVGVHSAADTEYEWEFYGELLGGAWFLAHPIQQPGLVIREDAAHPSTAHLADSWLVPLEEWYSFVRSPRDRVHVLLSIDEDSYLQDPNTTNLPGGPDFPQGRTGVMGDHPISWCHDLGQGRAWYTAMGHESYLYQLPDYRQHLLNGILTATGVVDADCTVEGAAPAPSEEPTATPSPTPAPDPQPTPTPDPATDPATDTATDADLPATGGPGWPLVAIALAATALVTVVARPKGT